MRNVQESILWQHHP